MSPIVAALRRHRAAQPDACALTDGEHDINYAMLAPAVAEAAAAFARHSDSTVALALDNGPAWAIADLALLASRRPCVPLPAFFSSAQQVHALRDAGARLLVTDRPTYYERLLRENGIQAVRTDDIALGPFSAARISVNAEASALPPGTAKVTYTSGTTGSPKGVCLDDAAIAAVATSLVDAVKLTAADRHLALLPLSTLLENIAGLYAATLAGACTVLPSLSRVGLCGAAGLSVDVLAAALASSRATTAITVPEILRGLCIALENGAARPERLRLLAVGGAHVSIELLRRAERAGLPVYEGYGLSECASVVALNTPGANRKGSTGRVLPHASVEVAADGEIHVRGATMLGYAGAEPSEGGAHATGDMGYVDDDGYLHITGRKRNVFITSYGRNVAPEWVESELTASDAIAQAWVHGESRPWNIAVITPRNGTSARAIDDAIAEANRRLPDYARVRRWTPSSEPFSPANGELTANGRLRRAALLARYGERLHRYYKENEVDVSR